LKKHFCIFLFILISASAFSQKDSVEIKGKVLSNKRKIVYRAELYLQVNDSVYKTTSNNNGEFRFLVKKTVAIAQLYIHSTNQTVCNDAKKSSFLYNHMNYKIDLTKKPEYNFDFELKNVNIDYSTPSILFAANSPSVVLDVKYGKGSAKIDEVMEYFFELTKRYPKMVLDIEGMVSDGETEKGLALARAKYIASLLTAKKVPAINLKTQDRGMSLPENTLTDIKKEKSRSKAEDLRAANRRVIIKILKAGEDIPEKEGAHF
jgi:outer membrane protein OmpA-like peptidoglycan-associated protein